MSEWSQSGLRLQGLQNGTAVPDATEDGRVTNSATTDTAIARCRMTSRQLTKYWFHNPNTYSSGLFLFCSQCSCSLEERSDFVFRLKPLNVPKRPVGSRLPGRPPQWGYFRSLTISAIRSDHHAAILVRSSQ